MSLWYDGKNFTRRRASSPPCSCDFCPDPIRPGDFYYLLNSLEETRIHLACYQAGLYKPPEKLPRPEPPPPPPKPARAISLVKGKIREVTAWVDGRPFKRRMKGGRVRCWLCTKGIHPGQRYHPTGRPDEGIHLACWQRIYPDGNPIRPTARNFRQGEAQSRAWDERGEEILAKRYETQGKTPAEPEAHPVRTAWDLIEEIHLQRRAARAARAPVR